MRILANEMKKIWNWKILIILVVIGVLFYSIFMEYQIKYYRGTNYPATSDIEYCEELARLYGSSITEEELTDYITEERTRLITEAEAYIKTMPIFAAAGIHSYANFEAMREAETDRDLTQAENDAQWTLFGEECDRLGFKLQSLRYLEENFDHSLRIIDLPDSVWDYYSQSEQERIRELVQNGENHDILDSWTYDNTMDYAVRLAILILFAVFVLVSPLLVSDRHGKLHYLQYSSRLGRKIMCSQLIATLLSAFLLTTLMLFIFGGIYSTNGTWLFWNTNISSDFNAGTYSLFSLTYGQWVLTMIFLMYVLALGTAMLAFILSRYSRNLITLIMKLIPAFTVFVFLCSAVFSGLFTMSNIIYRLIQVLGTEAYTCGIVDITGLIAALLVARREKGVDVV